MPDVLGKLATFRTNGKLDSFDHLDLDEGIVLSSPQHIEFWQFKRNCDTILSHLGAPCTSGWLPEIVHEVPSFA
jgi:hypothetical protein